MSASRSGRATASIGVRRLTLADFRCYGSLRLGGTTQPALESRPIVLIGPNGAGKTNLLEALSFLTPGRGLRRAKLSDIDRRSPEIGPHPWAVSASLETAHGIVEIGTGRDPVPEGESGGERRVVRIDGRAARGHKELARLAAIVWITPDMDRLFVEGAATRRRFLDRLVHGHDPEHAVRVSAYEQAMRERARLLERGGAEAAWLTGLEEVMAREGVAISASRLDTAARLDRAAAEDGPFPAAALAVAGEVESWLSEGPALAAEDRLREALAACRRQDAAAGGAAHGPHKSDLVVKHRRRDEAAARCSTGEQKALLLSVVLAAARVLAAERGAPPILLLDEVAAHLDASRRAALFDLLVELGGQAWLTGTDEDLFAGLWGRALFLKVEAASVSEA